MLTVPQIKTSLQAKHSIILAILACSAVIIGTALIYSVQTLLSLFLVCLLMLICLLLILDINKLLPVHDELKRAESSLEALSDVHWQWNLVTGVFTYKGNLLDILGYPAGADASPEFWKEAIHPVDRPQQKYQLLRHLGDESQPYYSEYRLKDNQGIYQWFAGSGRVVERQDDGRASIMLGRLDHIQTRKDLEQNLIHAHKMDALGQLTGGIAHDFNNILASILGYTELAIDSSPDDSMQRYLKQIKLGGARAKNVIKQLLDFSRHSKPELKIVSLQAEIQETIQMLQSTFPTTVEISETFPAGDCFTKLDSNQLQRVLLNLCINARDAMLSKGHLTLQLKTESDSRHQCASCHGQIIGRYHILELSDDGMGIKPVVLDKIFEPFFTTKAFGKGNGMGLSVVHGVVHEYGGHIRISSEENAGTKVSIYFPVYTQQSATKAQVLAPRKEFAQLNKAVLIIDDDPFVSRFLVDLLECYGCTVDLAESSTVAVQSITQKKRTYDLILSDQTMPGITGTELANRIYSLKPDLPIILYSGTKIDRRYCSDNVRDILQKPINNQKLIDSIKKYAISHH